MNMKKRIGPVFLYLAMIVATASPTAYAKAETTASARVAVSCHVPGARELVLVPFGQSNAANHLGRPYSPKGAVINFNYADGRCYQASDPLLGATVGPVPHTGSIWSILGDLLLETKRWDRVIIAPIAVGGSFMTDWTPSGSNFPLIAKAIVGLGKSGLQPTYFLWVQGEAEAYFRPDAERYKRLFSEMLAGLRRQSNAPVYIAIETTCRISAGPLQKLSSDERVRVLEGQAIIENAQRQLVDDRAGVRAGPNLDLLSIEDRWDSCHLNAFGQRTAAELWKHYLLSPDAATIASPPPHN